MFKRLLFFGQTYIFFRCSHATDKTVMFNFFSINSYLSQPEAFILCRRPTRMEILCGISNLTVVSTHFFLRSGSSFGQMIRKKTARVWQKMRKCGFTWSNGLFWWQNQMAQKSQTTSTSSSKLHFLQSGASSTRRWVFLTNVASSSSTSFGLSSKHKQSFRSLHLDLLEN